MGAFSGDKTVLVREDRDLFYRGGPFDEQDPRSLISIMPNEARQTVFTSPAFYFKLSEEQLIAELNPGPRLSQMRMAFWREYDQAQSAKSKMTIKGIQHYLGALPSFYLRDALTTPEHLAWILCPPASYENTLEEALSRGLRRINEILDISFYDENGAFDKGKAELVMKAVAFLDVRLNGMPTQRTETKNLNIDITRKDVKALGGGRTVEDLDSKIKALEQQLRQDGEPVKPIRLPDEVL